MEVPEVPLPAAKFRTLLFLCQAEGCNASFEKEKIGHGNESFCSEDCLSAYIDAYKRRVASEHVDEDGDEDTAERLSAEPSDSSRPGYKNASFKAKISRQVSLCVQGMSYGTENNNESRQFEIC